MINAENILDIQQIYSVDLSVNDMADCIQTSSIVLMLKDSKVPTLRIQEGLVDKLGLNLFYQLGGYAAQNADNPYHNGLHLTDIDFATNRFSSMNTVEDVYEVAYNHETNEINFIKEEKTFNQLKKLYDEQTYEKEQKKLKEQKINRIIHELEELPKEKRQEIINQI